MHKHKILVVEDLEVAQKAAVSALADCNCEIDIAENGQEAISLFQQNKYDLIFMDVGLPDLHGLTVVERIRELEQDGSGRKTPIIALTQHTQKEYQDAALEYGMNDFLAKPITEKKAKRVLDKYLRKS